ncbi:MAG: hypothetical protein LBQ87_05825 [Candidatus Fibromonas sp.]|nr:hypothetical protein [Candidatus Fibromonas sp.]
MQVIPAIIPLSLSITVQFLLWFNLLLPYNTLFEGFNRSHYLAFSLSGLFTACISVVFYRIIYQTVKKRFFIIAGIFQFLCILICAFFVISSLTGWLIFI